MSDLLEGGRALQEFSGLVACGGFSYGDVLGAGGGWARSILMHERTRLEFERFFARDDTFALGVCNGCQMFAAAEGADSRRAALAALSAQSQRAVRGASRVWCRSSPRPRCCSRVWRARGCRWRSRTARGAPQFRDDADLRALRAARIGRVSLRDQSTASARCAIRPIPTARCNAIAALTTPDGRVTICMPHPERVYRSVQNSWHPRDAGEDSGWMRLFRNARVWLG